MAHVPAAAAMAAIALAVALPAHGAEGSSLRGLRAPAPIDFAPFGAPLAVPAWQPGTEGPFSAEPQPSALYGFSQTRPAVGTTAPGRLSYSYSDSVTGILEAGPVPRDPYTLGYGLSGQVVRSFDSGLGVGLGLRQRPAGNNVVALGVQQGWGSFSGGYTLYSGRGDSTPSPSHRFALNYSYGNRSSIGLSYTAGRDLRTGLWPYAPGLDTRDWAITGHHWLAPQWAVTYDVVNSDQAAARRQGLRFGIRHTF